MRRILTFAVPILVCLGIGCFSACVSQEAAITGRGTAVSSDFAKDTTEENTNSDAAGSEADTGSADIPETVYITAEEAYELQRSGEGVIVDVRSPRDYRDICASDSLNIPSAMIEMRIREIPEGKLVIIMSSQEEYHVSEAIEAFIQNGISEQDLRVVKGGLESWIEANLPLDNNLRMAC